MLEISIAQEKIVATSSPKLQSEQINVGSSLGRVVAEDVVANVDVPPECNSAMDGYALHTDSLKDKNLLSLSQRIPAGIAPKTLKKNTAARIFTGATIPGNANAVVMQENCEALLDIVKILEDVKPGQNIRPKGQDIENGQVVIQKGKKITPQIIGLLSSIGEQNILVHRKIRITLISTGNELIEPGHTLGPGQIYNSNNAMLKALLFQLGCDVVSVPKLDDSLEATQKALSESAVHSDMIITTGGVSVGEEDHVKAAVESLGELNLWKIKIKPGKPLAFGSIEEVPFMGLPGNPVSAFVTFVLFAIPLIKKLQGSTPEPFKSFFLPTKFDRKHAQTRPEFVRVRMESDGVSAFANQSSGVLTSICWADALAKIPENTPLKKGELIEVFPLDLLTA